MVAVEILNEQTALPVDADRLRAAVTVVLQGAGVRAASISLAIVDDPTIHELNRKFLGHDFPTDVLSFVLDRDDIRLDGEIVVSADTASRVAADYGMSPADELLLYVVHGALHLVGHDDQDPQLQAAMRSREREYLLQFGVVIG